MTSITFSFIATFCTGVFFGAAIYISLVQHPAALDAGGTVAGRFFPPMYRRAAPMQASLAVIGSIASIVAWVLGAGWLWLAGGLVFLAVVPFTLLCFKEINGPLMDAARNPESTETFGLLRRWGRLHWVRTIISGLSLSLFLGKLAFG